MGSRPGAWVVGVLAAVALGAAACGGSSSDLPPLVLETLHPNMGVAFQQVDFLYPNAQQRDSTWGRLTVDPGQVEQATGIRGGRLNVVTDAGWVVRNAPVLPSGEPPYSIYFDLGLLQPTPLVAHAAHVSVATRAVARIAGHVGPLETWGLDRWEWNAEGVTPVADAGRPPLALRLSDAVRAGLEIRGWYQFTTNEQCAHNQCLPMAIANALEYLDDMGVIVVPHGHAPGLGGDATLVGHLDDATGRPWSSRALGGGVWFTPAVNGTFAYLEDTGLDGLLTHRHQGRGYGTPPGQALPDGDVSAFSSTTVDDGAAVTWAWIRDRVAAGAGVVAVYQHDWGGGHGVRVTAAGEDDAGQVWVRYSHDALQTNVDATDTEGLESVLIDLEDADGDGTLDFGSPDRELVFAWAHR